MEGSGSTPWPQTHLSYLLKRCRLSIDKIDTFKIESIAVMYTVFFNHFLKILFAWVLCLCIHICTMCVPGAWWRPEEGIRSPATGVTDG